MCIPIPPHAHIFLFNKKVPSPFDKFDVLILFFYHLKSDIGFSLLHYFKNTIMTFNTTCSVT